MHNCMRVTYCVRAPAVGLDAHRHRGRRSLLRQVGEHAFHVFIIFVFLLHLPWPCHARYADGSHDTQETQWNDPRLEQAFADIRALPASASRYFVLTFQHLSQKRISFLSCFEWASF